MMSYIEIYKEHNGKVSDKWNLYISEYSRLFEDYRKKPVSILEIGVQNGGALEIMGHFFNNAINIVGCDINSNCDRLAYKDSRIKLITGDANTDDTEFHIITHCHNYDIIIDDGSHRSADVVRSFARYFKHVNHGGVYITEDLHCSYWKDFEGGLFYPLSSMQFFKRLADIINHEHWGIKKHRNEILKEFASRYNTTFDEQSLSEIHSIEFFNSLCVIHKEDASQNTLGRRMIVGEEEPIAQGHHQLNFEFSAAPSQIHNPWSSANIDPNLLNNDILIKENDVVDLIIPYYNGQEYIEQAIASALNQSVPFDNIYIVDDGSDPKSSEFARNVADKYGVNYFWKPNGGQGSARNFGVDRSSADLICFLDQDDFLLPDHNAILFSEFNTLPGSKGWVSSNFSCCDQRGYIYQIRANPCINYQITNVYQMIDHDLFMLPSGSIISTAAFRSVGGFDEQFKGYEDDDLFVRLFRAGFSFRFVDKDSYVWRMHDSQTSSTVTMLYSRHKFINKWMNEDFGPSINEYYLKSSFLKRFRSTLGKDIIFGKSEEIIEVARKIMLDIINDHCKFIPLRWRVIYTALAHSPRPLGKLLYFIYKDFKR